MPYNAIKCCVLKHIMRLLYGMERAKSDQPPFKKRLRARQPIGRFFLFLQ